jgi:hypothetical protein
MMDDADVEALRAAGWDDDTICEATALVAFFNFSGRNGSRVGPADGYGPRSRVVSGRKGR